MNAINDEVSESLEAIPFFSIIRRLAKFVRKPFIQDTTLDNSPLRYAIRDFAESLLLIGTITDLLYFLLDNKLRFGLGNILSPIRLGIILGADEIIQVTAFYFVIFCFLRFKTRGYHFNIARQGLRSFAVINILMVPAWLIVGDIRLYAIITNTTPTYSQYFPAIILAAIAFTLLFPLLLIPVWSYLRKHYTKHICLVCLILAICTAKIISSHKYLPTTKFIVNKNVFVNNILRLGIRII